MNVTELRTIYHNIVKPKMGRGGRLHERDDAEILNVLENFGKNDSSPLNKFKPKTKQQVNALNLLKAQLDTQVKNHLDLAFIEEDGTEKFTKWIQDPKGKRIEEVLKYITVQHNIRSPKEKFIYLASDTFPIEDDYKENYDKYVQEFDALIAKNKRLMLTKLKVIAKTNTEIPKKLMDLKYRYIVTVYAVDIKGAGGHYAAYIVDILSKELTIFDSMTEFKESAESIFPRHSAYLEDFKQIGKEMFKYTNIRLVDTITSDDSYDLDIQCGGGFDLYGYYGSYEGQNHFCFMWSLLYIWVFSLGIPFPKVALEIKRENNILRKHKKMNSKFMANLLVIKSFVMLLMRTVFKNKTPKWVNAFNHYWDDSYNPKNKNTFILEGTMRQLPQNLPVIRMITPQSTPIKKKKAAKKIQAQIRGKKVRKKVAKKTRAAKKIQAQVRGKKVRKKVAKKKTN